MPHPSPRLLKICLCLLCLLLLAGCHTTPEAAVSGQVEPPAPATRSQPSVIRIEAEPATGSQVAGLNQRWLEMLLSAEIAGQRYQLSYALEQYLQLALETRHPVIAERAAWLAQYTQQYQAALDATLIWADAAPQDAEAQRTAAGLLLQQEQYLDAYEHLQRHEALSGESNYALLARHLVEQDDPVIHELFQRMSNDQATREQPSSDLALALAMISLHQGHQSLAQTWLNQALSLQPDLAPALLLQIDIDLQQQQYAQAETRLRQALRQQPQEARLWLALARVQLQTNQLQAASQTYRQIQQHFPDQPQIGLSLARIQLETGHYREAEHQLQQLVEHPHLADQAHYFLGQLAELNDDPLLALAHYQQVSAGSQLVPAARALSELLQDQADIDTALAWLDERRRQQPGQAEPLTLLGIHLLRAEERYNEALAWIEPGFNLSEEAPLQLFYARALLHHALDQLDQTEADLLTLLDLQPNNATALNALGYTLVDRTERIHEGFLYIQRAHALDSEAPEILDSMGWALFRLERYEEAREYLEEALERQPSEEILVHLAETLRHLDETARARWLLRAWQETHTVTPLIDVLLQRYPELHP